MNSTTTVLVTGATGRVGRHVVAGLRAAGVTVRAPVRTPDLAGLPPDGMIMRVIDPTTGLVATEWCPAQEREWFKPTDAPNEVCQEHFAPYYDDSIWQADGDLDPGRRDEPWTTDIRKEVGRALRRILRF